MNLETQTNPVQQPPMPEVRWAVDGVPGAELEHVWDSAWPYLERAIRRGMRMGSAKPYTEAEIYRNLMRGEQQLWIGWSYAENRLVGAVITEMFNDDKYPGHKFLSIPLIGAEHWMEWGDTMWNLLKSWGRSKGCTDALAYGRKGWARLYGFDECGTTEDGIPMFIRRLKEH